MSNRSGHPLLLRSSERWIAFPSWSVPAIMSKYKRFILLDFGTGLLERVGTGIVGTIGYVVLPTGVFTDVSRDIV